jgi:hypothetical protein
MRRTHVSGPGPSHSCVARTESPRFGAPAAPSGVIPCGARTGSTRGARNHAWRARSSRRRPHGRWPGDVRALARRFLSAPHGTRQESGSTEQRARFGRAETQFGRVGTPVRACGDHGEPGSALDAARDQIPRSAGRAGPAVTGNGTPDSAFVFGSSGKCGSRRLRPMVAADTAGETDTAGGDGLETRLGRPWPGSRAGSR